MSLLRCPVPRCDVLITYFDALRTNFGRTSLEHFHSIRFRGRVQIRTGEGNCFPDYSDPRKTVRATNSRQEQIYLDLHQAWGSFVARLLCGVIGNSRSKQSCVARDPTDSSQDQLPRSSTFGKTTQLRTKIEGFDSQLGLVQMSLGGAPLNSTLSGSL